MEQLGYVAAMVEIEFYGEVGTGLGPTLEFYSMLSLELQATNLNMWRCPSIVSRAELFPDGTALQHDFCRVPQPANCFARSRPSAWLWQRARRRRRRPRF